MRDVKYLKKAYKETPGGLKGKKIALLLEIVEILERQLEEYKEKEEKTIAVNDLAELIDKAVEHMDSNKEEESEEAATDNFDTFRDGTE